ncbi:unnamed protein product [Oikopleura dioica]|uniref:Uncharacterized protein n=1 Tax=Oikopleura dioica TaxID=34765 RepID=E4XPI5_OIKDI|nr:unnamed protein product [Oikopleura dioica]
MNKSKWPNDAFILVIPSSVDESYLQSGDGSSQISATINAPRNDYTEYAAYAIVNGKLHIFGGNSDYTKIARLDDCTLNELTVRLNEERFFGHAALSIEKGKKLLFVLATLANIAKLARFLTVQQPFQLSLPTRLINTAVSGFTKISRRVLDATTTNIKKLKRFLRTGWTALPDHPKRISSHSLIALENQSMLLMGGMDWVNDGVSQSGIWQLKDQTWSKIGELLRADYWGSAIYIGRSIYYFGYVSKAIQRLDFNQETEELQTVSQIGNQQGDYYYPVLFQTVPNYCV